MAENTSPPTFGFVPSTFPRDPVEINIFQEHMAIGQIIEPLVTTDREGNITPGLAEKWWIATDGKKMIFTLQKGLVFSNGSPLTAEDVKFSIERHLKHKSQSRPYLQCIESIKVTSPLEVEFYLSESQPAIIKALSRDHLGILPKGWLFNKDSKEPFIGTGAYRAVKQIDGWHFLANQRSRNKNDGMVIDWRALLSSDFAEDVKKGILPDYIPYSSNALMDVIEPQFLNKPNDLTKSNAAHFTQASAWWYPHGKNYKNTDMRTKAMCAFRSLLEMRRSALGLEISTGVIPKGVAGYLSAPIAHPACLRNSQKLEIKIAVPPKDVGLVFEKESVDKIEKEQNVAFSIVVDSPVKDSTLRTDKPDILFASWAGGFNDPEGFLPILTNILDFDLIPYFGDLAPLYLKARKEANWSMRSEYYQELNKALQISHQMIPAWKDKVFTLVRKNLIVQPSLIRYSPVLSDVRWSVTGRLVK